MSGRRILDIELLRGIAVLGVLVHHLQSMPFPGGLPGFESGMDHGQFWWGVDLFFVISGFVIARGLIPLLRGCLTPQAFWQETRDFWIRRAFRLLPSAWLWLLLMLSGALWFNHSGAFGTVQANLQATLAGFLQFANLRFAESFMRFEYGASFVYWSLSLEEQFYLLLPLLILVCRRRLVWVLLALVAVQLFTWRSALLMSIRTDALALGVLLAMWSARPSYLVWEPRLLSRRWSGPLMLIGVAAVLSVMAGPLFNLASYRTGALALLCAVLVWIASYNRDYLLPKGKLKQLLVWLGARSYGIYLIHIPAFFAVREGWFRFAPGGSQDVATQPALALFCALTLIVLLSELNYRFIELPMRNRGARLVQRLRVSRTLLPSSGVTSC
ncbi:acyltransferase [Pseudomonas frederiksbergensis]|uniref:acyltransferase family protein n=1 Tax=Pseudomonas frederiksbergensis TaxID=104087 RepID=UPI00197DA88C|nr:acyltransferase [Pseudomonas frederiksbergensis]MBN3863729.1 acyltransferase [Pseudomonas frederiksbergensis]